MRNDINWPMSWALWGALFYVDGCVWDVVFIGNDGSVLGRRKIYSDEYGPDEHRWFDGSVLEETLQQKWERW